MIPFVHVSVCVVLTVTWTDAFTTNMSIRAKTETIDNDIKKLQHDTYDQLNTLPGSGETIGKDRIDMNEFITEEDHIPRLIHQLVFNSSESPPARSDQVAMESWDEVNAVFKYMVWNANMVEELIREEYAWLWPRYRAYPYIEQRLDVARYVILHKYGGIFVDNHIVCLQPLDDMLKKLHHRTVVLKEGRPFGITNDFIAATPYHPFLSFVLQGLESGDLWGLLPAVTLTFSTGSAFLYGRYVNYPFQGEILVISEDSPAIKGIATPMWKGLDGLIDVLFSNVLMCVVVIAMFIMLAIVIVALRVHECINVTPEFRKPRIETYNIEPTECVEYQLMENNAVHVYQTQ